MRYFFSVCILAIALLAAPAARADSAFGSVQAGTGSAGLERAGILPQSWVSLLERNNISEQTALIIGGASAVAVGVGVYAGVGAATGVTGATLATVWLAHLPFHFALWGGAGYFGWNYLWPEQRGVQMKDKIPAGERLSIKFKPQAP